MSEIDLQPFCSTDPDRAYLMQPWTREGFTWATNGHILVRVPARREVVGNPEAPNAARIMACHVGAEFSPLPAVKWPDEPERKKCEICSGSGRDPEFPTHLCFECEGDGNGFQPLTSVLIRGVPFQVKYVRMIAALPGTEFAVSPNPPTENVRETKPTAFRFTGGVGALMPMKRGTDLHIGDIESLERAA